ncbi:UDP-3-O-acyl-N-acetylglucosamine deacetylase [Lentibacter sp. XHP0401]|uniref:UDP-3-O-acyl-N-acetylglucosamine deacetylase n=1 Tax=Lentibacter sp. XHP0401 TaxID=2984334 RepID=UPI0021E93AD9|nr:UDP-3-O-acyl-N-acetylglucosamine deacetylase [Lentibacter sp. XHP0401]MCV2891642.1 UDP-3-O-acyl-N-acetylglucosamine deacetylase [Lentibacter sp. XHP0401]
MQRTLKQTVTFEGVGLHSGKPATLTVNPAPAGHGVKFRRTDIALGDAIVPARWDAVEQGPLCTKIVNASGVSVSTIEHVMAALAGCGVYNALIDLNGPEVPILDGSAAPFVKRFLETGLRGLDQPVWAIRILRDIEVTRGEAWARLSPADEMQIDFSIDFEDEVIGRQHKALNMANGSFVRELCDSRTFCRQSDVDAMHEQGLALGGTLENAVVVEGDKVLSPGGLRHADEAVRHKMLDALGDLTLAGAPILGVYTGSRAGHAMTNALLRKLFETEGAFCFVRCTPEQAARLPGAGVHLGEMPQVA